MAQPIERIVFQRLMEIGGATSTVFNADQFDLKVDYSGPGRVYIDGDEFPYALVERIVRMKPPEGVEAEEPSALACDVCFEEFNTPQALGAHQRHKHGIKGSSRGRGEDAE